LLKSFGIKKSGDLATRTIEPGTFTVKGHAHAKGLGVRQETVDVVVMRSCLEQFTEDFMTTRDQPLLNVRETVLSVISA
jgi:hypothetical protein